MSKPWPQFQAVKLEHSQSEQLSLQCPYILCKKLLGTGSYANVYECKNTITGSHYAAKQFTKKHIYGMELMLQGEFEVLKSILRGHPNILSMVDYFETPDYFYLVTDLATGGELFERITKSPGGKLSVSDTRLMLKVLLSALRHLHNNGIVHRDIKAENILFASRSSHASLMLLADFGQARILKPGELALCADGTLSYLAPEVLARSGHSFPVDIWAVGVLTYFMLCGYMPFDCDTEEETKKYIALADFVFEPEEYWADIPETAKNFISMCFTLDPKQRITAEKALEHPFLAVGGDHRPQLKPVFSFTSLQKLQDAVTKIQHSRQRSVTNLTRLTKLERFDSPTLLLSSRCSLENLSHALLGEKCYSPEMVTNFTTPVTSALNSRPQSLTSLQNLQALNSAHKVTAGLPESSSTGKRTGNALFML